jgi:putative ABC transport system substrate-binding protein
MKKIIFYAGITLLLTSVSFAEAQQVAKVSRIGLLFFGSRDQPHLPAFLQGLKDLGYVERTNVAFEYRYAEGDLNRLSQLAAELVQLKVDVIVTTSNEGALAAHQVSKTIPVVMTAGDPVGAGLAGSLAKPGANVTGMSILLPKLSGKRLEILKEAVPKVKRLGMLWNPQQPTATTAIGETKAAAQAHSLQLHSLEVVTGDDIASRIVQLSKTRPSALLVILDLLTTRYSQKIVDLATKHRLPGMYPTKQFAEEGGLMAYGPSIGDLYRRAAGYVDKIVKGVKPADLPVEQPTKFEFFVNLKTAKQIGVTIPPNVLARADRVIK